MINKMRIVMVCIILIGSAKSICLAADETMRVSMINLIANPEKYHGKEVSVVGVSCLEFESDAIWLSMEDYQHYILKNSLWLDIGFDTIGSTREKLSRLNGKYVQIIGVFNKDHLGHMSNHSGTLENITSYVAWDYERRPVPSLLEIVHKGGSKWPEQYANFSPEEKKKLQEKQMDLIRKGADPLPVPLTPEQIAQLEKEGHFDTIIRNNVGSGNK